MSIDIDWETLTTGPEGLALAESIRDFIHDKFQQVQLPGFIRSVHVHSFDFGKECPVVELKDISDPLAEFYENDEDSQDGGDDTNHDIGFPPEAPPPRDGDTPHSSNIASSLEAFKRPSFIETRLPTQRSPFILADQITTPFLSRSNTPGIPGGTSNLSYFHLPLSNGLSGSQTPLAAVAGGTPLSIRLDQQHTSTTSSYSRNHSPQRQWPSYADPSSRPGTSDSYSQAPLATSNPLEADPASKDTSPSPAPPSPTDTQITLHITYTGSVSLSITAALLLDYPMSSFASIPLKLSITGLSFDGVALLAYLRKRAHFCFLGAEDAQVLIGAEAGLERAREGGGARGGKNKLGGLIREIRVESEIGKRECGKQSLKNVGKVEKFVVEQVRRIFEEEFVWPSWWTFLV
ncbi:mitochondrial distribution and morphology protein 12 [Physcia stellaris]|nr:mitochondrial distribution and morphology protein 12 [Physcia stellaris]